MKNHLTNIRRQTRNSKGQSDSRLLSETLCKRLRRLYGAQRQIALMCKIDQPMLSRILNRKEPASAAVREAIQKYLDWLGEKLQLEAMQMEFEETEATDERQETSAAI